MLKGLFLQAFTITKFLRLFLCCWPWFQRISCKSQTDAPKIFFAILPLTLLNFSEIDVLSWLSLLAFYTSAIKYYLVQQYRYFSILGMFRQQIFSEIFSQKKLWIWIPGYRSETERLEDVQGDHLRYLQQITAIRITLKLFPPFSKLY